MPSGILIVDKPEGWTSHDVVAKLRGVLGERRIGHGGTLDPMATGVLVVFVGKATRAVAFLPGEKTYAARFQTGLTTDTEDITGQILEQSGLTPERGEVEACLASFVGEISQIPPMVSAVKVGGRRLYQLARQGITVERAARRVKILSAVLMPPDGGDWSVRVSCSSGTYIRTLIHDLGQRLGCGACMTALRRVVSGPYSIDEAVTLEESGLSALRPVDTLFAGLPAVTTPHFGRLYNGLTLENEGEDSLVRVYDTDGAFLMLARRQSGLVKIAVNFAEGRN